MEQRNLRRTKRAKSVILRALGPLGAGPEEEESTPWKKERLIGVKAADGRLDTFGPTPVAAMLPPRPAPRSERLHLIQRSADAPPAAIQDMGIGQASPV
jgi:hypothetical protein